MYTIGGAAALPIQGPLTDMYGRRFGMFIGCAIVIVGTVISATGLNEGAFLAGRFLLGLGVSIASGAAPAYVVEIAPPAYRGKLTGLYNCTWWVGAITAAGCLRGTVDYPGNQNWRIPVWMQLLTSGVVCTFVFFIPESPRWLFSHGKKEEAFKIITKYHGEGNPENEFVKLQMREFEAEISLDGSDKRWWDYRSLFDTKPHRWRVGNLIMMDFMGQWAGNGVVSYYRKSPFHLLFTSLVELTKFPLVPAMLQTAGVTNTTTILNINLGNSLVSAAGAYIGAFGFVGILGRRQMLIGGMIFSSIAFAVIATGTGIYHIHGYNSAATAGIAFIFIFGFCYSFNITPLQALYPVEVLAYEQRGKGMALHSLCINLALLLNNFAWPVAMKKIGWYTYLIFVGWDLIQAGLAYLFMVETNHRTLEELGEIYAAPNPRKASTEKKKVYVDPESQHIVGVKGGDV
jgi:MFS family permease